MAISINSVFSQTIIHYDDLPQNIFLSLVNEVDKEIQAKIKLVPQQMVPISLTAGTGSYALPDPAMMIWEVGYLMSAGGYLRLTPTTFDYLDYEQIGWRGIGPGSPTYWYHDGGYIGLYPVPNATTSGGYPILNVYCTEQGNDYTIGSSLPSLVHSSYAWSYGVCAKWATIRHPDDIQKFEALAQRAFSELKAYVAGRNIRVKQKTMARVPPIRF